VGGPASPDFCPKTVLVLIFSFPGCPHGQQRKDATMKWSALLWHP
jgi:hypothetical protein